MRRPTFFLACALAAALTSHGRAAETPLTLNSARVSLDGTSNIHAFTASTTTVHVATEISGTPAADLLEQVLQPGGLKTFEVTIPAASLLSEKADLNKNMHKALKVQEHRDIRFRLGALEQLVNGYRATGSLTIAGIERQVAVNLQVERKGAALAVTGNTELLMTDYGIAPPKAMLGMLKTNPKVQIRIELLLGASLA
jgi:polyisoprenoid-binding protein YceI